METVPNEYKRYHISICYDEDFDYWFGCAMKKSSDYYRPFEEAERSEAFWFEGPDKQTVWLLIKEYLDKNR